MNIFNIDAESIELTEFGVGIAKNGSRDFVEIPVDAQIIDTLRQMMVNTEKKILELSSNGNEVVQYEPSEKYSGEEYIYLPTSSTSANLINELRNVSTFKCQPDAMASPEKIFSYFAVFEDSSGKKIIAFQRASQFKAIYKKPIIQFIDDSLGLVKNKVFKLDNDFDFISDSKKVHILRHVGFESICELQSIILDAVPQNAVKIKKNIAFVNFDSIESYATNHISAARYMASICSQDYAKNIDKRAIKQLCRETNVKIQEKNGTIHVSKGSELGFLEVLDRRRYQVNLVKGVSEKFKASSRKKI